MIIKIISGYEPNYPKKPGGTGKKLAAVTAAAVLAAGRTACRSLKPELSGAPIGPDDTPLCTEAAGPAVTSLLEVYPEESTEPALEGDVAIYPDGLEDPVVGGAPIPDPTAIDAPEITGLIMPDPGTVEGD